MSRKSRQAKQQLQIATDPVTEQRVSRKRKYWYRAAGAVTAIGVSAFVGIIDQRTTEEHKTMREASAALHRIVGQMTVDIRKLYPTKETKEAARKLANASLTLLQIDNDIRSDDSFVGDAHMAAARFSRFAHIPFSAGSEIIATRQRHQACAAAIVQIEDKDFHVTQVEVTTGKSIFQVPDVCRESMGETTKYWIPQGPIGVGH